jgi:L-threonylcarbamoyladenylate synthase
MKNNIWNDENLIKILLENGVAVMPTDTIYGLVGKALEKNTVERIYKIKKRNPEKPCIILIGNITEIEKFGIKLAQKQEEILKKYWPGPVSVILDCSDNSLVYLHRGTKTLAFRVPAPQTLRDLLFKTGPLIAPSANPEDLPPAKTGEEAKKYFGNSVDLYMDGGILNGKHSKLIKLNKDGSIAVLRE